METSKCVNCGAPDQSLVEECQYCGHQPPVPVATEPVRSAPDNVVPFQGEISKVKLFFTSLAVGYGVFLIGTIVMGG